MLPLTFADSGQIFTVSKVNGREDTKKHLEDLGLISGSEVEVMSAQSGNLIIKVKGSRLAITSEMAQKIMVEAQLEHSAGAADVEKSQEVVKAV